MEAERDVLAVERPRRTSHRIAWVLALILLAVGVVAWAVDDHRRAQEGAALHACRAELAGTLSAVSYRMGAMGEYWRPAWSTLSGARAREVADHLSGPARSARLEVAAARRTCQRVEVWPWHGTTAARRSATLAYADGWLEHLDEVARSGSAWFRPDEDLSRLGARAGLT